MKKLFIIIFIIISVKTFSQNNGIGFRLGDPSGVTYKRYFGDNALEINLGLTNIFDGNNWYNDQFTTWYNKQNFNYAYYVYTGYEHITEPIGLQVHYLYQKPIKEADSEYGKLDWYFGYGGQLKYQSYSFEYEYQPVGSSAILSGSETITDFKIGVDCTVGAEYKFSKVPISVFLDVTLSMELYSQPFHFWGQCGIGARYNF